MSKKSEALFWICSSCWLGFGIYFIATLATRQRQYENEKDTYGRAQPILSTGRECREATKETKEKSNQEIVKC